ncbi:unnamed protein product, partial [Mesorhabditis spiculigera]
MSNDLSCKETLNVEDSSARAIVQNMAHNQHPAARAAASQMPQQGPLQIPHQLIAQASMASPAVQQDLVARFNQPANLANIISMGQSAPNLSTIGHTVLQQHLLSQMQPAERERLMANLQNLQSQPGLYILQQQQQQQQQQRQQTHHQQHQQHQQLQQHQHQQHQQLLQAAQPQQVVHQQLQQVQLQQQHRSQPVQQSRIVQNVKRPPPAKTATAIAQSSQHPLARPPPPSTPPTPRYDHIHADYKRLLAATQQAAEQQRINEARAAAAQKAEYEEQQRKLAQQQVLNYANGLAAQHRNPIVATSQMHQPQPSNVQHQQAAMIQELLAGTWGMSNHSTLDHARELYRRITDQLQQPGQEMTPSPQPQPQIQQRPPPQQTYQQSQITSQLFARMGGNHVDLSNMTASHALSQTAQQLHQAGLGQPTSIYQQQAMPSSSQETLFSPPRIPHATPPHHIIQNTTSSPRPQPSILRRRGDAGPSPSLKRRLDDSRPTSGNGIATPPDMKAPHRALQFPDDNRESPYDDNGESPKKRNRKQTFDTETNELKLYQHLATPKAPQPKRRGRPPRSETEAKLLAQAELERYRIAQMKQDTGIPKVPLQGPLVIETTRVIVDQPCSSKSLPPEQPESPKSTKPLIPDLSFLEKDEADAVMALVNIREEKAQKLYNRETAVKTLLAFSGPFEECLPKREKLREARLEMSRMKFKTNSELGKIGPLTPFREFDTNTIRFEDLLREQLMADEVFNTASESDKKKIRNVRAAQEPFWKQPSRAEIGLEGALTYDQLSGSEKMPKAWRPSKTGALGRFKAHDPFKKPMRQLRVAERDFATSYNALTIPKPRPSSRQEELIFVEDDPADDIESEPLLLPVGIAGHKLEEKEGMSTQIGNAVREVVDCMMHALSQEDSRKPFKRKGKDCTKRLAYVLSALPDYDEEADISYKPNKGEMVCSCDLLDPLPKNMLKCEACKPLVTRSTNYNSKDGKVKPVDVSNYDYRVFWQLKEDCLLNFARGSKAIVLNYAEMLKQFKPDWYRRMTLEQKMDIAPTDLSEIAEWKKVRRIETFICGYPYLLPEKPVIYNDQVLEMPARHHITETMASTAPFRALAGPNSDNPAGVEKDRDWKPLRWPVPVLADDIKPLNMYDTYRLRMGLSLVAELELDVNIWLDEYSSHDFWEGTFDKPLTEVETSFRKPKELEHKPYLGISRRKRVFNRKGERYRGTYGLNGDDDTGAEVVESDLSDEEEMQLNESEIKSEVPDESNGNDLLTPPPMEVSMTEVLSVEDEKPSENLNSSPPTPVHVRSFARKPRAAGPRVHDLTFADAPEEKGTFEIAQRLRAKMEAHVDFIREPLAGYLQSMERAVDVLTQNMQIYRGDVWQIPEHELEPEEPENNATDNDDEEGDSSGESTTY